MFKIFYYYFNYAKFCQPVDQDSISEERPKAANKKEMFEKFQDVMDTFVSRIPEGSPFHGGLGPDAVDFRVYSWINRFLHTFTMKSLMFARGGN